MFRKNFGIFETVEAESSERVFTFFARMLPLEFFETLGELWDVSKPRRKAMSCIFIDFQLIPLIYMILISLDTVLQRAAQHQENKLASQSMKSIQEVQLG